MTVLPEPPQLRAVASPAGESLDGDGLALAYAGLERVRSDHGLHRLNVVVDDPVLGRQVLVVPRGELPSPMDEHLRWWSEPPIEEPSSDIELAVALCRTALRVEVATTPADTVELGLRRLDGVEAVAFDVDGCIIRLRAAESAADTVAVDALNVVKASLDHTVVVEVVRTGGMPVRTRADRPSAGPLALEVIAVRRAPERGELEVHLRGSEIRTVGRAALTRGIVGAAEATLEAWHARPGASVWRVAWARTVETSAYTRFVVAVALETLDAPTVAYGIGTGSDPIEATVQATVDALGS